MKRLPVLLSLGALLWGALSLGAQAPTARDSAHAAAQARLLKLIDAESRRSGSMRKTQTRAWADTALKAEAKHIAAPVVPVPPPIPAAPVASFAVSCALVTCSFNAAASTGTRLSFAWDVGALPNYTGTAAAFSFSYPHEGARTAVLTVRDSLGRVASVSKAFTVPGLPVAPADTATPPPVVTDTTATPAPAELPRALPAASAPTGSTVVSVPSGADLQAALTAATPGTTLRLAAGATYTGNFTIPARACGATDAWVTVTTATTLPPAGTRVTPTTAAAFAKIVTPNTEAALRTTGLRCRWQFVGVEIAATSGKATVNYGILKLGDGGWAAGGDVQTSLAVVPQDWILDRVYLHGGDSTNTQRCLGLNSGRTAVVNSWLAECHAKGFDSQAIEGWNGPGPYLIENNFLAGAGENVMFGGADPGITGLSPSDITIRRNHVSKDPQWRGVWTVKNLFELKNARRVLVESNVFENNWADAQSGMAIVIKSSGGGGSTQLWQGTTDVTFRYNIVRDSPRGLNVQAVDCSGQPCVDVHVQRVTVTNNLFERIGAEGDAWLLLLTNDPADIAIARNTFLHDPSVGFTRGAALMMDGAAGTARRLAITENIMTAGAYGVFYSGGFLGSAALTQMAGTSWTFTGNALVGGQSAAKYPAGNLFPSAVPVGSTTVGADVAEVLRRTAGVVVPVP